VSGARKEHPSGAKQAAEKVQFRFGIGLLKMLLASFGLFASLVEVVVLSQRAFLSVG
jgi:hypothetical protein